MDSGFETTTIAGLLVIQVAATWYLVGLCWLVQRVQYPLMARVGVDHFVGYESAHVARITPVVGPPMLLEAGSAVALWLGGGAIAASPIYLATLPLLALVWLSTAFVQVPLHRKLSLAFDARAHASLVRSNWIRTAAWTLRGVLLLGVLWNGVALTF